MDSKETQLPRVTPVFGFDPYRKARKPDPGRKRNPRKKDQEKKKKKGELDTYV